MNCGFEQRLGRMCEPRRPEGVKAMTNFLRCIYSLRTGMLMSRMKIWAGHVARMGQMIDFFVRKPERKNPHGVLGSTREGDLYTNNQHVVASVERDSSILNTASATICYVSWGMLEITIRS
jgi:hypothetical protein